MQILRDPHRRVVTLVQFLSIVGSAVAVYGGLTLGNPVWLDTAVSLALSAGILTSVGMAQRDRQNPVVSFDSEPEAVQPPEPEPSAPADVPIIDVPTIIAASKFTDLPTGIAGWLSEQFRALGPANIVKIVTATAGLVGICYVLLLNFYNLPPDLTTAVVFSVLCLGAAGLAATVVRYFADGDPALIPEAPELSRGARVVVWIFTVAAVSVWFQWANQPTLIRVFHIAIVAINVLVCSSLFKVQRSADTESSRFRLDIPVLAVLGNRMNVFGSVLDAGEQQLGIDLRSTWALTIVRRSLEPLLIGLCVLGWLSTSFTVVGMEEQGLVERLGVPLKGQPLFPGIHLHWPWPVDHVFRISVQRVQSLSIGHEGEEGNGPENVLWAVEHAANEYTLLLGNGRDLITVDAAIQFRIADARAWRYHSQNPADALRAIGYRAVMRSTVNKTLSEALSENIMMLTSQMRSEVQQDADALGLGIEVMGFTVGGMHPPVAVASNYQAVVSAELRKVTAAVNAQVYRNHTVPSAESWVLTNQNDARSEGAQNLAKAAGEAWSFRALESQYRAAPEEYLFRRRLEALEKNLAGHRFTVVDARFQRDGGELWVIP